MNLRRAIRRWLQKDDSPEVALNAQCYPETPGTRAGIVRIDNGWLLECAGTTRYVSDLSDIPNELPGLIAKGKMLNEAAKRY